MTTSPQTVAAFRCRLLENGYLPIPVTQPDPEDKHAGKRPAIKKWSEVRRVFKEDIDRWQNHLPSATNTGIICGNVVAIDIDVAQETISEKIKELTINTLGKDAPVRVGRSPRMVIVYRTKVPFKKKKSKTFFLTTGEKVEVEILNEGQHFVAAGIHPETLKPYVWLDRSLEEVKFIDLLEVDEAQIDQYLRDVNQIFEDNKLHSGDAVIRQEEEGKLAAHHRDGLADLETVKDAMAHVPNDDTHYDQWVKIGFALHSGLGEAGFELWDEWSRKSSKYDATFTWKTWRYFKRGGGVSIGTLFFQAKQNGWRRSNGLYARHIILIENGNLPETVDQAEQALLASDIEIYQRGGIVIRPIRECNTEGGNAKDDWVTFVPVSEEWMRETFMRVAIFKKAKAGNGDLITIDCPNSVASTYLARVGNWRLPKVNAIIRAPTLRHDGTIVDKPGYDETTCFYAAFDPKNFTPIEPFPMRKDAITAINKLKELISTFPFAEDADQSVALAAILTGLVRMLLDAAPMIGFSAPVAGSGKSLLVDMVSIIITGRKAGVMAPGRTEEELEKRLGAALLSGETLISLDNCTEPLQGAFLCQILTQSKVRIRILGLSKNVEVPTGCLILATGNNLTFADDMTRRSLICTLNPKVERPEERQFAKNPLNEASNRRSEFVAAGLTILRAFILSKPAQTAKILGSYAEWSKLVRAALVWLDEADPCSTMERIRDTDPGRAKNLALLSEINHHFNDSKFYVSDLTSRATDREQAANGGYQFRHRGLHQALADFCGGRDSLSTVLIGKALSKLKDRIFDGMTLIQAKGSGGRSTWQLIGGKDTSPF